MGNLNPTSNAATRYACCALFFLACCIGLSTRSIAFQGVTSLVRRDISVDKNKVPTLQTYLRQSFPGRLFSHPARQDTWLLQIGQETAAVQFNDSINSIRLEGPSGIVADLALMTEAIGRIDRDSTVRFLPLNDNGQASLAVFSRRVVESQLSHSALGSASPMSNAKAAKLPGFLKPRQRIADERIPSNTKTTGVGGYRDTNIRLASGAMQPPGEQVAKDPNPAEGTKNQDEAGKKEQVPVLPLPQFEGVQIEMLPELDAVILRGRETQLTDLSEIIKRLDEVSRLTRPEIEIVPLQHVNSLAISELIETTQDKLVGTQQGRVTVTALGTPNALLLIGWGESMLAMKDLIRKLDQPTSIDSSFAVIPLQHAIASEIQTQLQTFFKSKEGLAPVINTVADSRSNAIVVQASPRDLQEIRRILKEIDVPRGGLMQSARVFQLKHSLAVDVAKSLEDALTTTTADRNKSMQLVDENGEPIVSSGVLGTTKISVNERNNSIVVSCAPENLSLVAQFIEQLDTPGAVAKIKIFPVQNGDAATLVETLRSLIPSEGGSTQGGNRLSSSPNETALLALRFTVDTRGNNIIAIGSEGDLKIVEALILRLDEDEAGSRKSTVYQLKNSPAVDVALAINEFLRSKRQVEIAAPGASSPFEQLEKEVVVVPEPVQNKLIMSATPRYYDEIAKLIEELDQQPPQVMIQVMIAEITLGNTDEFGIEMGLQDSVLFDRSLLGDLVTVTNTTNTSTPAGVVTETVQDVIAASNIPGFNFNNTDPLGNSGSGKALNSANRVGGQGISNFSVGRGNEELGFGGLVLSASSENVSFLLRALQDSRRLEILSRPQVLTLDNQQAFIQVGQRVPRIVNSIITQQNTQNVVALENVGLIIGVTPRISPEGNVVMEIDAEKSKLGPENEGIPISIAQDGTVIRSPRVDTITAQATVSAADGETIILGGLISRSTRTLHRQVPWLGDIPIIKYLFSYDFNSVQRTELLIIMTPHVVRSSGDMERLKQAEFARMSWCEADVFELHGDVFPRTGMMSQLIEDADCKLVYPDSDPRGGIDGTAMPLDRNWREVPEPAVPRQEPTLEQEIQNLNAPDSLPQPRAEGYPPMRLPIADNPRQSNSVGFLPPSPSATNSSAPLFDRNVVPARSAGEPPLLPMNWGGSR
jgi:general secretion pathway protein D